MIAEIEKGPKGKLGHRKPACDYPRGKPSKIEEKVG